MQFMQIMQIMPILSALLIALAPASVTDGYRDSAALSADARTISAASNGLATVVPLGTSREGRELVALRMGTAGDTKPALLITAGLDGTHLCSSEVALGVAKELLSEESRTKHPDLFDRVTIWIIPRVNPDALDRTLQGPVPQRGAIRPFDDDRDGSIDEDPPQDLDGDGVIVQMRVKDPPPPFVATMIADPAETRLLKKPETGPAAKVLAKPEYAVFTEGIDADGDGRIAEDGLGEVDLDRNFPHRYPEFARDAGPMQISEPESKALTQFVLAHPEIIAAITYGRHDSLVKVPDTRDMDATGRTPLVHLPADLEMYQALGKVYRDTSGQTRAASADHAGSFWLWLANHRGVLSLASTVWGRPDVPKETEPVKPEAPQAPDAPEDAAAPEATPLAAMGALHDLHDPHDPADPADRADDHALNPAGLQTVPLAPQGGPRRRGRGGAGGPGAPARPSEATAAPTDEEAVHWLAYSDAVRDGAGFIPWHEVAHPLFGTVEVGGFDPLFRLNPPAAELPEIAKKQTAFLHAFIDLLPVLDVSTPVVTKLSDGVYRIESSVMNAGRLPTASQMGVTTEARAAVIVRLSAPLERIVSGERVRRIYALESGERVELAWVVQAPSGSEPIELTIGNSEFGTRRFVIQNGVVQEAAR
ncbi:MAG: M14 family zinc carboxypeptidase [Phycisphaerae bacterium]|nr:M14 family zinc carboxypeptidase [Phycisphaerae bacterium]